MEKRFLNAESIFAEAERNTGLQGIADPLLRTRIMTLIDRFNGSDGIAASSIDASAKQIRDLIATRLQFEHEWHAHPEIAAEIVERPIFVVGFSRTGTSAMQALLAQDSANRAVNWAQSCFPVPAPGWDIETDRERDAASDLLMKEWIATAKGILTAHPYWDEGAAALVENEELFALDFRWGYYMKFFKIPSIPNVADLFDPFEAFAFHKRLLQYWQWKQPRRRWVTKGVVHQFCLDALWASYPDALCIWTHRDPATMITSSMGINAICHEGILGALDREQYGRTYLARTRTSITRMLEQPWADDPRVIHVRFNDFLRDQIGTIRTIYDRAGIAFTDAFGRKIRTWLADPANRSDRHGKFGYKPEDFGLNRDDISRQFQDYSARFLET